MIHLLSIPLIVIMTSASFSSGSVRFEDVPVSHWGGVGDSVEYLQSKGLIEGYPDNTFRGDQPVTRYEAAMIFARLIARLEKKLETTTNENNNKTSAP